MRGHKWLGHQACNRFVHGVVALRDGEAPAFHPVREEGDAIDERIVDGFLQRFGGISFRLDGPAERAARMLGVLANAPLFATRNVGAYAWHWLRRLDPERPLRAARELASGRLRVHGLALVSHHFMSADELATGLGQERVAQCVFHVPVSGRLVSMCEVNAAGLRDAYYAELRRDRPTAATAGMSE